MFLKNGVHENFTSQSRFNHKNFINLEYKMNRNLTNRRKGRMKWVKRKNFFLF